MPNDRWFIKPHIITGYTIGTYQSGYGYGVGIRCLYDFEKIFLGGSVFLGLETSFLSPLGFENYENVNPGKYNYLIVSPIVEQNYKWLNYGFQFGFGFGDYMGIQFPNTNVGGFITNIGWFPIYNGKAITPYITYRNDWIFDKNKNNMQSLNLGINF